MRRHSDVSELQRQAAARAASRRTPGTAVVADRQDQGVDDGRLDPISRDLLGLQRSAGNAAVARAVARAPLVQRQPKKQKAQPAWLKEAQAELGRLFPKNKLMQHVILKDYRDLNKALQTIDYGAWTQSGTEIYIRDQSKLADPKEPSTKDWPIMATRYALRHEAVHIGQFAGAGAPPSTWKLMLEYEKAAYTADLGWLTTTEGEKLVPDQDLRDQLVDAAEAILGKIDALLGDTAIMSLPQAKREAKLHARMKKEKLIPASAKLDPKELYKQPP